MKKNLYIERALFVVGNPNAGKSTQLRSIFADRRFIYDGKIPRGRVPARHSISHDRNLYIRLTSPHENGETLSRFLKKTKESTRSGRWVVVSPLQLKTLKGQKMPDMVKVVRAFVKKFKPERVRVCFLNPTGKGDAVSDLDKIIYSLWRIPTVECMTLDARSKTKNGLILADFCDFS